MINITIIFQILIIGFSWMFRPLETYVSCPPECICLSQTQILCNTGGLNRIPLRTLPSSVENLSLTKNNFSIIKPDSFTGLRALKKLSLDTNNITKVKQFAFRGLPRLQELSIQNNPLKTVSQFAFAGLQNLSAIFLSHNQIVRIEGNAFAGTSNVNLILLTSNPLTRVETSAFSGLTNVGHLLLPSGIREIEADAFYGMENVGLLKLSYMDLKELQPYTFRGLTGVQFLTLQDSDLGVICADAFSGLNQVGLLHLLNNKIDAIEELNITYTQQIKHLKLEGNHLLEMPEPNTIILDGVDILTVDRNHFPCGCHIHTLLDSPLANGTYQNIEFLSKNYCISPLEVNGKPMISLDIDSIGRCQEQVTKGNLESSATTIKYNSILQNINIQDNLLLLLTFIIKQLYENVNIISKFNFTNNEIYNINFYNNINIKNNQQIEQNILQTYEISAYQQNELSKYEIIRKNIKKYQKIFENNEKYLRKSQKHMTILQKFDHSIDKNIIAINNRSQQNNQNEMKINFQYNSYPCHNQMIQLTQIKQQQQQQQQHQQYQHQQLKQYYIKLYSKQYDEKLLLSKYYQIYCYFNHDNHHHHHHRNNHNNHNKLNEKNSKYLMYEKSIYSKLTFILGIYFIFSIILSYLYPYQIQLQR